MTIRIEAAVVGEGQHIPAVEQLELSGPGPGEVLVRIVAAGICHTDVKAASGGLPLPRPVVLGHEGAGIVERVGAGITRLAQGDHVALTFASCGHCPSCLEAEPAYCHNQWSLCFGCTRPDGSHYLQGAHGPVHGDFFGQSSFATYAIANERNAIKVRKDAPLEMLAPLGCGIQTGAGAVLNEFGLKAGQSLAVFGAGSLGLSAVMAARLAGASTIIAVDRHANRLDLARDLGADHALVGGDDTAAEIIRLTGGGVDFALDTTAARKVMRQAFEVLAIRGTCGYVARPSDGEELSFDGRHLQYGRTIRGILEGNSNPEIFIPRLVEFYMSGRFPVDRLVRLYPFDRIADAFHDMETGVAIKPVLQFPQPG